MAATFISMRTAAHPHRLDAAVLRPRNPRRRRQGLKALDEIDRFALCLHLAVPPVPPFRPRRTDSEGRRLRRCLSPEPYSIPWCGRRSPGMLGASGHRSGSSTAGLSRGSRRWPSSARRRVHWCDGSRGGVRPRCAQQLVDAGHVHQAEPREAAPTASSPARPERRRPRRGPHVHLLAQRGATPVRRTTGWPRTR